MVVVMQEGATEEQVMAVATGHAMHSDMMHSEMAAGRGGVAWP